MNLLDTPTPKYRPFIRPGTYLLFWLPTGTSTTPVADWRPGHAHTTLRAPVLDFARLRRPCLRIRDVRPANQCPPWNLGVSVKYLNFDKLLVIIPRLPGHAVLVLFVIGTRRERIRPERPRGLIARVEIVGLALELEDTAVVVQVEVNKHGFYFI